MALYRHSAMCFKLIPYRRVRVRVVLKLTALAMFSGFVMFTMDKQFYRDECLEYNEAGRMPRTVHRDVLETGNSDREDDITLVTQLSSSRYDKLRTLFLRWSGPISAAIYLNNPTTTSEFKKQILALLGPRDNIALHFVNEKGRYYPVNFLRNVALENAKTKFVFLTDVDFEPMPNLDVHLQNYISKGLVQGKTALVVPAFEALYANIMFPENKADVLTLWKTDKTIIPFHFKVENGEEVATAGHAQTLYPVWLKATKPYNITYKRHYEPYVVVERKLTPKYRPYLVDRFYDKESHLEELSARQFRFLVLPDLFIIHTPHVKNPGTRMDWRCALKEYNRFRNYLKVVSGRRRATAH